MSADLHLRALFDAEAFAEEEARLGQVWTLVGYASDIPRENDWFRAVLGGRSIFIQRFAQGLHGFQNRCAHRSYPLRTTERGNGPIICGFHHWRYDSEGTAAGIPNCQDAFGTTSRELGKSLIRLDVACCGDLVFARFAGKTETLATFLGPAFGVLEWLCAAMGGGERVTAPGRTNWRLNKWISLDDYHLAAVHSKSLETATSYLRQDELGYRRFGMHSAFLRGKDAGTLEDWASALRQGLRPRPGYRIIHLFPQTSISFIPSILLPGKQRVPFSYVTLQRHLPIAVDRTDVETIIIRAPQRHLDQSPLARLLAPFEGLIMPFVRRGAMRVLREDLEVCENLQKSAHQIAPDPLYGASEIRVAWFNEAYAQAMRPTGTAP